MICHRIFDTRKDEKAALDFLANAIRGEKRLEISSIYWTVVRMAEAQVANMLAALCFMLLSFQFDGVIK